MSRGKRIRAYMINVILRLLFPWQILAKLTYKALDTTYTEQQDSHYVYLSCFFDETDLITITHNGKISHLLQGNTK
jgi:hypothetical protein